MVPAMRNRRGDPGGAAVVTSIVPCAPLTNSTSAVAVSSASMS